ncbi:asparagine synthetase B family protein [Desulfobacula toluolica]|uniref:asparagine synthase (glutamine-hydrolyzing) n=1 Tax=Desulfobacula toluolica (strain DSM 7467 / Tol2) TaxID=651182 RepID=K0NGW6_DESTT|nr:asparagine synthase-related protein [Desulfobacula toluolica]CCK80486.1 AsnB: asparagine synthetase [Desulfobacula toluolica Tol2]
MSQGIFGIIDFKQIIDQPGKLAATMGRFLNNSGSRKAVVSCKWDDHYILGMKRISEISIQQPGIVKNEDLQLIGLIHGEIHNYESLLQDIPEEAGQCSGDLDLALQLYRLHGKEFYRKFNGLFSLAILDLKKRAFFLANDRFGMAHQIYWTNVDNRFYFATHLKTLLSCPEIHKEIDFEALNLFLKYSYVSSPWSMIKGIHKLSPGNILVCKNGTATQEPFWDFNVLKNTPDNLDDAVFTYKELLKNSIARQLDTHGQVGILLSGGLDSSANVALASQCMDKKLKTFSVGFEDSAFDERPYARIVADHFGTQHHEYSINGSEIEDLPALIWHLEEPYFELGLFLTYQGMAAARKETDVILGGEAADQIFGTGGFAGGLPLALRYILLKGHLLGAASWMAGSLKRRYFYEHDNLAFKFRLLWNRVADLNDWFFYGYDEHELRQLHQNPLLAKTPRIFPDKQPTVVPDSFADLYRETQINQDIKHFSNENLMVKSGRMADMLDLTLRESYLDTELTDFMVSVDYGFKRSGGLVDHLRRNIQTKFLHRKAMEGLLPPEIMAKPKQGGFVPVMIFLENENLRKRIYMHLLNSDIIKACFNLDYIKTLFGNYEQHLRKKVYWHNFHNSKANRILFLLTFDIWHHFYLSNDFLEVQPMPLSEYLR